MLCLHFEIVAIPSDETVDAILYRGGGFVVELIDEVVDVGVGVGYVSGLLGQEFLFGGLSKRFFDGSDVVHQLHR